jgi:hypothetical protein
MVHLTLELEFAVRTRIVIDPAQTKDAAMTLTSIA